MAIGDFGLTMKYNLLESHKEFARWLVEQNRSGYLGDSFSISFSGHGDFWLRGREVDPNINVGTKPNISQQTLRALEQERMLLLSQPSKSSDIFCGLLGRIFSAVETNFGELEAPTLLSTENLGGIGLNTSQFSQILARDFSLDGLKTICHNMNIKFESLPGAETIEAKARELVLLLQRHGRLLELLIITAKARPKTDWSSLY